MQMLLQAVRKWRRRRSPAIALNGASASINGCGLATLADYEAALGAHSRKLDALQAKNTLYFWDRAGIVAYAPLSSDRIASFTAYLARGPSSVSPKTRFAGSLTINGVRITRESTLSSIRRLPFLDRLDDNQYSHDQVAQFAVDGSQTSVLFSFNRKAHAFEFEPRVHSFAVDFGKAK